MTKTILNPDTLASPRGFAHGILTQGGRMLFLAGQMGTDSTGKIGNPFDLIDQFRQTLENLQTIVRAGDGTMTDRATPPAARDSSRRPVPPPR